MAEQAENRKNAIKQRIRPTIRATQRQEKAKQRPLPPPPPRRSITSPPASKPPATAVKPAPPTTKPAIPASKPAPPTTKPATPNKPPIGKAPGVAPQPTAAAAANAELVQRMEQIQSRFSDLEAKAQLGPQYTIIGAIDQRLIDLPQQLEGLRTRRYAHNGALEDKLEALDQQWDQVRPQVEAALQDQVQKLDRELEQTQKYVVQLRPVEASLRMADGVVNNLSRRVDAAIQAVEGPYDGLDGQLTAVAATLATLDRMLALYEESPHIQWQPGEAPLAAVEAQWQQNGKEGPEGILFLTDQRFLFEQREEVVTKRTFGIFKAESQKIQKILLETAVGEIESVTDKEEGGFLGMGKADILELVFAATAAVTRARFHLKGQESADWAALIRKAQSGEIDQERAPEYVDEVAALSETAATYPTECPNCLAPFTPPGRGVSSAACEFCGTIITPTGG